MFTFSIDSDFGDTSISFSSSNLESIVKLFSVFGATVSVLDDEADDEGEEVTEIGGVDIDDVEFDDEGYAWTFDAEFEAWFWFDDESEEWVEYEDEESEDEAEEE
jgi:hypothetical protein